MWPTELKIVTMWPSTESLLTPDLVPCFVQNRDLNNCRGSINPGVFLMLSGVGAGAEYFRVPPLPPFLPAGVIELLQIELCFAGAPGMGLALCVHPAQPGLWLFTSGLL